ncbi:YrdB family protein [Elongatibacter sediminis]|uniref:YrdB family protein n=1 Tax=Elongatibacter sediminis TaxID=3119006 RepID=A0AAW9RC42_9GAMM
MIIGARSAWQITKGGHRKRHGRRRIAGASFDKAESRTSAESLPCLIPTAGSAKPVCQLTSLGATMTQNAPPMNPANLLLRFLLEIAALTGLAMGGWHVAFGWPRPLMAVGLPVVALAIWGIFRVPNDPSSNGRALISIGGVGRLIIEAVVFASGVAGFFMAGQSAIGISVGGAVAIHYCFSYRRIGWLLAASK